MTEFAEKIRSIGLVTSRPRPREYRDGAVPVKEVTDEHGNVLTYRGDKEAPGVDIRPETVTLADGRQLVHKET